MTLCDQPRPSGLKQSQRIVLVMCCHALAESGLGSWSKQILPEVSAAIRLVPESKKGP